MRLDESFEVSASPEQVYALLLDVNRVAGCVPGAELSEILDSSTFRGKVKIKVGPITVAYDGTARITEQDQSARSATLQAEGRETTGPGSARATTWISVEAWNGGSRVHLATDFTVAGRVANFGRGVMEDVSKRLLSEMASCIRTNLEPTAETQLESPLPPEPRQLNALGILFAVLWGRIKRLFGR
jgi:carbon monoxide dehydrogenase subunit G